jgi:hypothetical protein
VEPEALQQHVAARVERLMRSSGDVGGAHSAHFRHAHDIMTYT